MLLAFLVGCERDPSLLGYWDITAMRAGADEASAEAVTEAGFLEFQATGDAYGMFSYTWTGAWVADPRPDLVTFTTDAVARDDFVETYKSKGETYTVSMTTQGATNVFDILDWKGSTVTLSSEAAAPPGQWDGGAQVFFEIELER